jgi:DNA-binding Xre family transcriptional regulator
MSEQRISTAPVQEIARAKGIDNPYRLSTLAGIDYRTAKRYWYDDPERYQLYDDILLKIADVLDCEPNELIVRRVRD